MIQITDLKIIERTEDEESGDMYYTAQVQLLEPGAAFSEDRRKEEISKNLEENINKGIKYLKEVIN